MTDLALPASWDGLRDWCLRQCDGDHARALEMACRIADDLRRRVSGGYMRAALKAAKE